MITAGRLNRIIPLTWAAISQATSLRHAADPFLPNDISYPGRYSMVHQNLPVIRLKTRMVTRFLNLSFKYQSS